MHDILIAEDNALLAAHTHRPLHALSKIVGKLLHGGTLVRLRRIRPRHLV